MRQALAAGPEPGPHRDEEPRAAGDATPNGEDPPAAAPATVPPADAWAPMTPTDKGMGLVRLTLDRGVRTTAIGQIYGLDFEIEGDGFVVRVFFDHYNRRLKVLDYSVTDYRALSARLTWLARANEFDKIFLKAKKDDWQRFLGLGFMLEGILRYFYRGEDAYVLSKFGSNDRISSPHLIEESELIEELMSSPPSYEVPPLPEGYRLGLAREEDIPALVALYRTVFKTYPSPLTHPDYIQQTMRRNMIYRIVVNGSNEVVSAASAEVDEKNSNAELTDCATLKTERGRGLMYLLLSDLESDLRERGIMNGYTLARARSVGMNRVFYRLGYEYSGRLLNNCDIYGQYEDMNIWVKRLGTIAARPLPHPGANGGGGLPS